MKNRILIGIAGFFAAFLLIATPSLAASPSPKPKVDSFELFWPIVAGRVRGDSLYSLKLFKEKVRESLIFSSFKKADYKITISEKRLVEVESLFKKGDYVNGGRSIEDLKKSWDHVVSLINESSASGIDVINLKARFISSLDKQSLVLKALSMDLKDEPKSVIEKLIELAKKTSSTI